MSVETHTDYLAALKHRDTLLDQWLKMEPAAIQSGVARMASAFLLEPLPLALEVYSQTIPKTVVLAQQQLLTLSQKLDSEVHLGS